MPNNVINKVVYGDRTLIDLTDTTATAETILSGYGAYGADGVWVDGTATAGSLSGHVWQDNEGYIHLDDDGGDMYITTPLNVTTNGTYTAPTGVAYTPVSVSVPQGADVPKFTVVFNNNSTITVTCDKTYNECLSYYNNGVLTAIVIEKDQDETYEISYGATIDATSLENTVEYKYFVGLNAVVKLDYTSSNTITRTYMSAKGNSDMTVSGATVTASAGWYPYSASKSVTTTTHPNPTASITNSTGVVTASHTQTAGYVSAGTTTGTTQLTTQAAQTIYPSSSDQTISSYRWLTGTQTIKGVTTTNLTAANIKSGVTVQVGDSADSDRVTSVTGTYVGRTTHTITLTGSGASGSVYVQINGTGTQYYSSGTVTFTEGDTLYCRADGARNGGKIIVDGVTEVDTSGIATYTFNLPNYDTTVALTYGSTGIVEITTPTASITTNGVYDVSNYNKANVDVSGGGAEQKKLNFIDYDGTILYSYTAAEALVMQDEDMPSNPTHTGLVAQGWNYTTAQIRIFFGIYPDATLWVGQLYYTASGDTEIDYDIDGENLSPYLSIAVNGTATIDWGDNSTVDTIVGTELTTAIDTQHTYASSGSYVIKVSPVTGSYCFLGNAGLPAFHAETHPVAICNTLYTKYVKAVRMGENASIGTYAFAYCINMKYITLGNASNLYTGTTSGYTYAFTTCNSLKAIVLPNTNLGYGKYAFSGCVNLARVSIRASNQLATYIFNNCYSLKDVSIGYSFSKVDGYAFNNCYSLTECIVPQTGVSYTFGQYTYNHCDALEHIYFPSAGFNATSLGNYVFSCCYSLREVTLPDNITTLGTYLFDSCVSLEKVVFPSALTSVDGYTFRYCIGLKEIHMKSTTPPTITSTMFYNASFTGNIYVPYSADHSVLEAYQTATYWSTYASQIVEESP